MKQEKQTLSDFPHQLTFQLTKEDFIEYGTETSQPQLEKTRQRAWLFALIFGVVGTAFLVKGFLGTGRMSQLFTVAGVVLIAYQAFNLVYNYFVFPAALKKSVAKEVEKDPRLTQAMTLCFDEEKIVSFCGGKHQVTFFIKDIVKRKSTALCLVLVLKNGKQLVIPKRELEKADSATRTLIEKL